MTLVWRVLLIVFVEQRQISAFALGVKTIHSQKFTGIQPFTTPIRRSLFGQGGRDSFGHLYSAPQGPESSLMPDYISDFLLKQRQNEALSDATNSENKDDDPSSSFLIAIPMEDSHDLLLQLESVQRAILYHCPVLVHACLVPAQIRLPLLYVHTKSSSSAASARELRQLTRLVQGIVQEEMFATPGSYDDDEAMDSSTAVDNDIVSNLYREVNVDGIRPLVMTFQSLQTAGRNHQALYTLGKTVDESDSQRLLRLVSRLQQAVESLGWTTSLSSPYEKQLDDPHQSSRGDGDIFEARVPFMRLPANFESFLEPTADGQDPFWRTSEQGGNGISPIFWCQWWEDVFARDVRLRQIGIYPQQPQPLSTQQGLQETPPQQQYQQAPEEEYHVPYELIPLPSGNAALAVRERQEKAQQQERLLQQFQKLQEKTRPMKDSNTRDDDDDLNQQEDDVLLAKTQTRLEPLYQQQETIPAEENDDISGVATIDNVSKATIKKDGYFQTSAQSPLLEPVQPSSSQPDSEIPIDDWTRERIRQVVEARSRNKFGNQEEGTGSKRKDLPPIEENSIFLKYKNGSLVNEESPYFSMQQKAPKRPIRMLTSSSSRSRSPSGAATTVMTLSFVRMGSQMPS